MFGIVLKHPDGRQQINESTVESLCSREQSKESIQYNKQLYLCLLFQISGRHVFSIKVGFNEILRGRPINEINKCDIHVQKQYCNKSYMRKTSIETFIIFLFIVLESKSEREQKLRKIQFYLLGSTHIHHTPVYILAI